MPYDPTSQSNLDEAKTNHIHLNLAVDFDAKILSGSAELEIEAIADAVTKVILDTSFIDIRSASIGGQTLNVKQKIAGCLLFRDPACSLPANASLLYGTSSSLSSSFRIAMKSTDLHWLWIWPSLWPRVKRLSC